MCSRDSLIKTGAFPLGKLSSHKKICTACFHFIFTYLVIKDVPNSLEIIHLVSEAHYLAISRYHERESLGISILSANRCSIPPRYVSVVPSKSTLVASHHVATHQVKVALSFLFWIRCEILGSKYLSHKKFNKTAFCNIILGEFVLSRIILY